MLCLERPGESPDIQLSGLVSYVIGKWRCYFTVVRNWDWVAAWVQ